MVSELEELRQQLQCVDEQLIRLLAQRQHLSGKIGTVKHHHQLDIEQLEVWERQHNHRMQLASELNADKALVEVIFEEIHAFSKAIQQQTQSK